MKMMLIYGLFQEYLKDNSVEKYRLDSKEK
jgi:hypothetical protein